MLSDVTKHWWKKNETEWNMLRNLYEFHVIPSRKASQTFVKRELEERPWLTSQSQDESISAFATSPSTRTELEERSTSCSWCLSECPC